MTKRFKKIDFNMKSIGQDGIFSGYASVFDVEDLQKDIIINGAFARSLSHDKNSIKLLWQHKADEPIGIILQIKEDMYGLYVQCQLLMEIRQAKEAYQLLKYGAVTGLSIGYSVVESFYDEKNNNRLITDIDLYEISLVTFPANEQAQVNQLSNYHIDDLKSSVDEAIKILEY